MGKNLLLVTFDQWRGDWGNPRKPVLSLPTIEKLAKKGWVAERCYTASPQCMPARFSWLTGLEPSQMGVTRNCRANLPEDSPSLIRNLQQEGWHTSLIGKAHWTDHMYANDLRNNKSLIKSLGFDNVLEVPGPRALVNNKCELTDEWIERGIYEDYKNDMRNRYRGTLKCDAWRVKESILPLELYPDIWITNKACQTIKDLPKHQNWLLWVSYVGPHEPFDTPKQWDFVDAERLPVTIKQSEWIARLKDSCELKKSKIKWEGKLNSKEVKELRVDYGNKLKLLDDQLNKLMNEIHDREDAKNTAVCITSDHGEMLGDHGMLYKNTFLEQAIRVPMIYISPDAKRRHRMTCKEPIQTTKALKAILRNLRKQGKTRRLQKWATKQQGAIVEHNDEIAFISRDHKLCCTQKGEFLWATRPERS